MVGWLPAITPKAPNKALVMQVEVSTLPATTEAGGRVEHGAGRNDDLDGLEATGIERNIVIHQAAETYSTAAMHTAVGVEVVLLLRRGARESPPRRCAAAR